jgi:sodium transport system ATP-binding protein
VIQVQSVHKHFDVKDKKTRSHKRIDAVKGVSFAVQPGEIYGLLGPNGAGKSTTLRMIAGLMQPTSGSIQVCGLDSQREPEKARAKLGYLSTDVNIYGRFTPREFLRLFGEFQGVDARVAERRGLYLLEKLQLSEFSDVKMEGFSSGQKQKVGIARALLHERHRLHPRDAHGGRGLRPHRHHLRRGAPRGRPAPGRARPLGRPHPRRGVLPTGRPQ